MKLHPLSIPVRAVAQIDLGSLVIIAGVGFFGGQGTSGVAGGIVSAIAILVFIFIVQLVWGALYYQRFEYTLTDDTLDIDSGVISRRERNIPIRRIQNIDIVRDPAARLASLAAVSFETAGGGGDAEGEIRYVTNEEADRLQNEIQRLKRAQTDDVSADDSEEADAEGTDTETMGSEVETTTVGKNSEELFSLSTQNLLLASAFSLDLRPLVPMVLVVFEGAQYLPGEVAAVVVGNPGIGAIITAVGSFLAGAAMTFARYYDFRLWRSGDELRYERGLVSRYTGSIPFEKIQNLVVGENVLMRRFGYATLDVETAGYGTSSSSRGSESVVPIAEREAVFDFARSIEGFEFGELDFSRPPKRARRRYAGRYAIVVAVVTGVLFAANHFFEFEFLQWWFAPLALVIFVPFAAHYKWRNRGVHVDEGFVLTRNGFWNRTVEVIPYYRVQTVIEDRSIFQRRWRLATVVVDTAGSRSLSHQGARAVDFDRHDADDLRETVRQRLHRSVIERRSRRITGRTQ